MRLCNTDYPPSPLTESTKWKGSNKRRTSNAAEPRTDASFEWATLSGRLHGDPARPIRPPEKRGAERTTFSADQERAILAQNDRRDGLALHLLLKEASARVLSKAFGSETSTTPSV